MSSKHKNLAPNNKNPKAVQLNHIQPKNVQCQKQNAQNSEQGNRLCNCQKIIIFRI